MTGLICCTLDCNLACSYCYEGNGEKHEYPKLDVINHEFLCGITKIDKFIDELYEYNENGVTTIIWHGGEPTLIDCKVLDKVMDSK